MAQPSLKELLEAGAHFGHQTRRWNPKMNQFIYGARGGVHIIDLTKTADLLKNAADFVTSVTANGGQILFVGTKRQAKPIIIKAAKEAGMPFVTERWLGGMLTNYQTIRTQVNRLKKLEAELESGEIAAKYNKKETADLTDEAMRLDRVFGGIKDMNGLPAVLFVVDMPKEDIAVLEAKKLGIPVVGIVDTNADPDLADYPIPANDDAIKAVQVITNTITAAAMEGKARYGAKTKENQEEGETPDGN